MKVEIVMPKMGESVNDGTILKWHKKKGDKVQKDDILFEISTDKVDTEIPSPVSGYLAEIKVFEQETVAVGTVVAYIETEEQKVDEKTSSESVEDKKSFEVGNVPSQQLIDVVMPKMGESVTQGTILKWHKKVGDKVNKDDILFEISTDKVDTEVPSAVDGYLTEILVSEQETVDVGVVVARISPTEFVLNLSGKTNLEQKKQEETTKIEPKAEEEPKKQEKQVKQSNRFYSPLVLKIASEENVSMEELERIEGTGLEGRVTKKDILKYVENRKTAKPKEQPKEEIIAPVLYEPHTLDKQHEPILPGKVEIIEMDNMRQLIMQHMIKSRDTSVHVMGVQEVDMSRIERYIALNKENFFAREGVKLTYMPFIISATVKALKDYPFINASIEDKKIIKKNYFNIGFAVALDPMGLIVPVIKNADEKNLVGLAKAVFDLGTRARNKKLLPDEVKDSTFTITNYGVFGTLFGNPIINQPEVAILGVGAVTKKPVVVTIDGQDSIVIKPMMYLSLSHDHRLVDGALAGKFLSRVKEYLENFDARII